MSLLEYKPLLRKLRENEYRAIEIHPLTKEERIIATGDFIHVIEAITDNAKRRQQDGQINR